MVQVPCSRCLAGGKQQLEGGEVHRRREWGHQHVRRAVAGNFETLLATMCLVRAEITIDDRRYAVSFAVVFYLHDASFVRTQALDLEGDEWTPFSQGVAKLAKTNEKTPNEFKAFMVCPTPFPNTFLPFLRLDLPGCTADVF